MLFDGVCWLCNALVQVVLRLDRRALFDFASLQSPEAATALAPLGLRAETLETLVVIAGYRSNRPACLTKARAVQFVMAALGQPWRGMSWLAGMLPRTARDRLYDAVARHRYQLFGRREQCLIPRPEFRERFIDASGPAARGEVQK